MSTFAELQWSLEKERRRQEYLSRIRETTARYCDRYMRLADDLARQGLDDFMPAEFEHVRARLLVLRREIDIDPERARKLSMELGEELSRLPAIAREARREFKAREVARSEEIAASRREARTAVEQFLHTLVDEISDPIEQDFAFDDIRILQNEYAGRVLDTSALPSAKDEIRKQFQIIQSKAAQEAQSWKQRKEAESLGESQKMLFELSHEEIVQDIERNPNAMQQMLESLEAIRLQIGEPGGSLTNLQRQLQEVVSRVDDVVVDERCRRATVRAVVESLQQAGFVVDTPQRVVGEKDEVVISARRPAGAEAAFRVTSNGGMSYKFEKYEGMACKSDIDRVLPILQKAYGIELSNERILWQNPDRISRSARPVGESGEQKRGK